MARDRLCVNAKVDGEDAWLERVSPLALELGERRECPWSGIGRSGRRRGVVDAFPRPAGGKARKDTEIGCPWRVIHTGDKQVEEKVRLPEPTETEDYTRGSACA